MDVKRTEIKQKYKELVNILKEALQKASFYKQKPGKPKKVRVVKELSLPSKILRKYRHRAYKSRKKLLEQIENHPVIGNMVKEYKDLLYNKLVKTKRTPAENRYYANLTDTLDFRFRRPTMMEQNLIGDYVLPSRVFDRPMPADLDFEVYKDLSMENKLDFRKYLFRVKTNLEELLNQQILPELGSILEEYLEKYRRIITESLIKEMAKDKLKPGYYLRIVAHTLFEKGKGKEKEIDLVFISSKTHRRNEVYIGTRRDIRKVVSICLQEVSFGIINFEEGNASGYRFLAIDKFEVYCYYYKSKGIVNITEEPTPIGLKFRELPEWIKYSKSIINIQNTDDSCFKWCITRFFYREEKNNFRITKKLREYAEKFDWLGLDDPKNFCEEKLCQFEDINNLTIIVFSISDEPEYHIHHMRNDKDNPKYTKIYLGHYIDHFFLITNLYGFIGAAHRKTGKNRKSYFICEVCFNIFSKKKSLENHINACKNAPPIYKFPKKSYIEFKNYQYMLPCHGVCYADFEATTTLSTVQIPNSFCIFCPDLELLEVRYSSDPEELFTEFWKILKNIHRRFTLIYKANKKFNGTLPRESTGKCEYCEKQSENLVIHHDHFNGKFLGYACDSCNSKMKVPKNIRIFFHNLKGYDSHFIIKYGLKVLAKETELQPEVEDESKAKKKISVLGRSKEKLFSIRVGDFIFLDSFCHLDSSLSQLIKDYVKERRFKNFLPDWYTHKEAYPYEWFNTYEKFDLPFLPEREAFYSSITKRSISEKEYQELLDIFNKHCKTFKDFHDIYLRGDVILLAEVFEKYRELSLETYKLDPAWYVSAPSFFYDAMKLYTKSELPIILDYTIYEYIKRGIRGGIVNIGEISVSEANENSCILYLDTVNLYGKAMMEPLPTAIKDFIKDFKNEDPTQEVLEIIRSSPPNIGHIFEVDIFLHYDLHDKFKAYPLFPEKINGKLMQTLYNKEKYIVLDRYLEYGIRMGYKVTKIHSVIEFTQEPYMRKYIEKNTEHRRIALKNKETSKVAYFKMANNAVFGKNIENPEKYTHYVIYSGDKAIEEYNKPETYKNFIIIDNDEPIILFDKKRSSFNLNKPIIIGFCILDISKHIMAEHFYRLKDLFGDKMKLIYTDTDSLVIEVQMPEKEAIKVLKDSDPEEKIYEFEDSKERKVPGRLALEKTCNYFRAFAAKHYIKDREEILKGVPKCEKTTSYAPERTYNKIRSKNHTVIIETIKKKISYKDDKKVYIDERNVVPWGFKGLYSQ